MNEMKQAATEPYPPLAQILAGFQPISLDALKGKAELMDRRDNKYVLTNELVYDLMLAVRDQFDILTIDGLRQFHYLSHYYDTPDLRTYDDHNKGRRRRIKVRHRHYVDSERHYCEIKLKGFRQLTEKFRIPFNPDSFEHSHMNQTFMDFCHTTLSEHYGAEYARAWLPSLSPSISIGYRRITLVAKQGAERITIDNGIYCNESDQDEGAALREFNENMWIVEVKSASGRTAVDRLLLRRRQRPVSLCSKYGMGVSLLRFPETNNRFSQVFRRYFKSKPAPFKSN